MEGIPAWQKYKRRAAIYLIRWDSSRSTKVWNALRDFLDDRSTDNIPGDMSYISKAIMLRHGSIAPFAEICNKYKVTEQQLWALLIDRAVPGAESVDDLSDADAQISRLAAMQESRDGQIIHATLRASAAVEAKLLGNIAVADTKLRTNAIADAKRSEYQSNRASNPRNVIITLDGVTDTTSLIKELATKKEYEGHTAKKLWPIFTGLLDELGCDPKILPATKARQKVIYQVERGERELLDSSFATQLSFHRKKADDPA